MKATPIKLRSYKKVLTAFVAGRFKIQYYTFMSNNFFTFST